MQPSCHDKWGVTDYTWIEGRLVQIIGDTEVVLTNWVVAFRISLCKGCDPCSQLLCGMLQEPSAVHILYTHSISAHGPSTGTHNTLVAIQWLGQRFCYSLVQLISYSNSMDIVWRHFKRQIKSCWLILTCKLASNTSKLTHWDSVRVQ